jgi:hypothetical protein
VVPHSPDGRRVGAGDTVRAKRKQNRVCSESLKQSAQAAQSERGCAACMHGLGRVRFAGDSNCRSVQWEAGNVVGLRWTVLPPPPTPMMHSTL